MANVTIPYPLVPAVAVPTRRAHMLSAIARGLERLDRQATSPLPCYIACYGPSLRDTYEALRDKHPLIAMSGATKFLAEQGITADYALEMDPRESQLIVSLPPVPGVTYLVASCVCPAFFDQVLAAGNRVVLWHTVSTNWEDETRWVSEHDRGALVISAGSTVGLGAIQIGGLLGFSRFEIHGMDGSFDAAGQRHAGPHGGKAQPDVIEWQALNRVYKTSKIMANAVAETINTAKNFPIITIWHGDGLTQALIRKAHLANAACVDEVEKVARLRGLQPQVVYTPPLCTAGRITFWDALLDFLVPQDWIEIVQHMGICEPRRAQAKYNTGTIPFESAIYLRGIARFYRPTVVAEVGTFIGTSTLALHVGRVIYTCDRSNDCVPATESIVTHPYRSSTVMVAEIQEKVDLFFFDGRIQSEDLAHLVRLSHPGTVYVVDDYRDADKGVVNAGLLASILPRHTLVRPAPRSPSTLAIFVPYAQRQGAP